MKFAVLASVRPLLTYSCPLAPTLPAMVTASSEPEEPFSALASLLVMVPLLITPLSELSPPAPKVAAPMSSVPPPRFSLPVMLKLPALRLILPLMSPNVKLLALPLLLPRLITPPLCVMVPALLNVRGRTSSVPVVAPIPPPAPTLMRLVWIDWV